MSLTSCTILVTREVDRTISMTRSLSRALNLGALRVCTLRVGTQSVTVALKSLNRSGNYIAISSSVASAVRLPSPGKCLVKVNGTREIQVGPLVGILTGASNDPNLPFGGRTSFLRDFMRAGRDRAFFFAFSPRNVNWQNETITGYFPNAGGGWVRKTVPLPDVVYNRLPDRKAEKSAAIREFKERFLRRRIPFFNWGFFEKSEVYQLLEEEQEAYRHVPESVNHPTEAQIRQLVEKHRFIYLKPTAGSLGFGIYRLTHNPGKGYFVRFRQNGQNVLMRYPRFDGVLSLFRRHRLRLSHYVLQQGVRLIEIDGCPIDFRFHTTKNGQNEWVVAGIGAKKAGRGSVTTHVRTGGELMTPESALRTVFGSRADAVLQQAKETAVKLAEAIERNHPYPLGEIGLDLGIDQQENIWMFEANSKPGRTIFKHPSLKEQGKEVSATLFQHCLYLSRFRARRE